MAVAGDLPRRVAGVVDEDLLGDEEDPTGSREAIDIEGAVSAAELHQVDARQIAGGVVEEHVLRAGIARIDPA